MPPLCSCDAVTRVYHRGNRGWLSRTNGTTVTALDAVSLSIASDEVILLSGPSGSGKSTLLHLIAGLDIPTSGSVTFQGRSISEQTERERTQYRRDHVGIVFQDFRLLGALSARANVALPLIEQGVSRSERRRRASALLEEVGLGDRLTHKPAQLSGGERQRVAIARALVTDPDLIIADEPTGELDTETGEAILSLLTRVGHDRAVVIASHDPETSRIVDRTITLRDGKRLTENDA